MSERARERKRERMRVRGSSQQHFGLLVVRDMSISTTTGCRGGTLGAFNFFSFSFLQARVFDERNLNPLSPPNRTITPPLFYHLNTQYAPLEAQAHALLLRGLGLGGRGGVRGRRRGRAAPALKQARPLNLLRHLFLPGRPPPPGSRYRLRSIWRGNDWVLCGNAPV